MTIIQEKTKTRRRTPEEKKAMESPIERPKKKGSSKKTNKKQKQ